MLFCLLQLSVASSAAQVAHSLINVHALHRGHFFSARSHDYVKRDYLSWRLSVLNQNSLIRETRMRLFFSPSEIFFLQLLRKISSVIYQKLMQNLMPPGLQRRFDCEINIYLLASKYPIKKLLN